nr:MAG TPA: CcmH protein [Caudoviricetes sp.]
MGELSRRIHGNPMAEAMSKIIGQLAWEKRAVAEGQTEEEAREAFRKRYGESYL